jgi:hypothetical protein
LQRAVTDLGFAGALINGRTHGRYLDDPAYEDLFERAETLGVPIYLHPTTPHPAVMDAWFAPYVDDGLHLASCGFAVEAGTHALRLIYSGRLQRPPSEYLRNNFYVTTSGNVSPPAFACTPEVTRAHVSYGNAARLFGDKIPARLRGPIVVHSDTEPRHLPRLRVVSGWLTGLEPATSRITTWCSTN